MRLGSLTCTSSVALAFVAFGSSACAEVYTPRPTSAVVITGNGGSGYRVYKDGHPMGDHSSVEAAVEEDPRALAQAEKASSERVGAVVSNIGGAVAWGVGWAMLGDDASSNTNQFPTTAGEIGIGLIVGGAVLFIVGGVLQGSAHTHMFNAVNIYNDDLAARGGTFRPPAVVPSYAPPSYPPPGGGAVYISPGPGYAPQPTYPPSALPPLPPPSQPMLQPAPQPTP